MQRCIMYILFMQIKMIIRKNIGPQNTAIIQSESSSLDSQTSLILIEYRQN